MTDNPPQNNEHLQTPDDVLLEANLWNPLWAYDLFPISESGWNRMPIAGANFETESSAQQPESNGENSNQNSDTQNPNADKDQEAETEIETDDPNEQEAEGSKECNENGEGSSSNEDEDEEQTSDNNPGDAGDEANTENEPTVDQNDSADGEETDDNENLDGDNLDDPTPNPRPEFSYSLENPEHNGPPPIPGFSTIITDTGTIFIREFNSWEDFVETVADDRLYAWKTTRESHNPKQRTAGAAASFDEAVEMARYRGWPEGRKLLSDLLANITTKNESFEVWSLDVAGMFPIVPAYLSGDPNCMMVDPVTEIRTQYPIIRIDFNHECDWMVTPQDMMIRGAAVLSLANSLEAQGFQTELRIVGNSKGIMNYDTRKTDTFQYSIVYKKPGQFLDIDRAAYALAHPSCLRRLSFALVEQHAELEAGFSAHYGFPTGTSADPDADTFGVIFIPGSSGSETEEKSRQVVSAAASATTAVLEAAEAD